MAERLAFQEEQAEILQFLEQKRDELDAYKVTFLKNFLQI